MYIHMYIYIYVYGIDTSGSVRLVVVWVAFEREMVCGGKTKPHSPSAQLEITHVVSQWQ